MVGGKYPQIAGNYKPRGERMTKETAGRALKSIRNRVP
jgi:hypothetical protein